MLNTLVKDAFQAWLANFTATGCRLSCRYHGDEIAPPKRVHLNLKNRPYISLALWNPSGKYRVCHGNFCCRARFETDMIRDQFYLFAFDGYDHIQNRWALRVQVGLARNGAFLLSKLVFLQI